MGYWAAGHVLLAEPNVASLNGLPAGLNWKLYKAKDSPVWLLDTYQKPPEKHGPFSDYIWRGGDKEEVERFLPGYSTVVKVLASYQISMSISTWLLLSRQLSEILEQRVFTFVSDDDITR